VPRGWVCGWVGCLVMAAAGKGALGLPGPGGPIYLPMCGGSLGLIPLLAQTSGRARTCSSSGPAEGAGAEGAPVLVATAGPWLTGATPRPPVIAMRAFFSGLQAARTPQISMQSVRMAKCGSCAGCSAGLGDWHLLQTPPNMHGTASPRALLHPPSGPATWTLSTAERRRTPTQLALLKSAELHSPGLRARASSPCPQHAQHVLQDQLHVRLHQQSLRSHTGHSTTTRHALRLPPSLPPHQCGHGAAATAQKPPKR
jgi:hypothetical protein